MATFEPIRTPNAIDQAVFVIKLACNIGTSALNSLESLKEKLPEDFDSFEEVSLAGVVVTSSGVSSQDKRAIGIECRTVVKNQDHALVNERSDWMLRIVENSIQVNCLSYMGWEQTRDYASLLLSIVFECLPEDEIVIAEISYQVNDTFVVTGEVDTDKLDYSQLFVHSMYLTENVWERGSLWHVNSGWFDKLEEAPTLNVLNISARKNVSGSVKQVSLIEHLQRYSPNKPVDAIENKTFLEGVFQKLHDENKKVVRDLLTTEVQKRIGLL